MCNCKNFRSWFSVCVQAIKVSIAWLWKLIDVFERVVFVSLYLLVDEMPVDKTTVEEMACYLKKNCSRKFKFLSSVLFCKKTASSLCLKGAMTFSRMPFSRMSLSIMIFSIMLVSIITFSRDVSRTTLSRMALSCIPFNLIFRKRHSKLH